MTNKKPTTYVSIDNYMYEKLTTFKNTCTNTSTCTCTNTCIKYMYKYMYVDVQTDLHVQNMYLYIYDIL